MVPPAPPIILLFGIVERSYSVAVSALFSHSSIPVSGFLKYTTVNYMTFLNDMSKL